MSTSPTYYIYIHMYKGKHAVLAKIPGKKCVGPSNASGKKLIVDVYYVYTNVKG